MATRTAFDAAQNKGRTALYFYLPIDQYITLDMTASVQRKVLTSVVSLGPRRTYPMILACYPKSGEIVREAGSSRMR